MGERTNLNALWIKLRSKKWRSLAAVRGALTCCGSVACSGCVVHYESFSKPIDYHETPKSDVAYLYGRFEVRARRDRRQEEYVTLAFQVDCTHEKSYKIRFTIGRPLQLIEIAPESCSISEVLFTTAYGEIVGRKPVPMWLLWDQRFEAGTAYYVGDFFGVTQESDNSTTWAVSEVHDNYESTTRTLKAWFPGFAQMPTVDRVQLPPETKYDPFAMREAARTDPVEEARHEIATVF